jgi:hypothetical protein
LYPSISFSFSSFVSTQYSLGVTKSEVLRHSGHALKKRNETLKKPAVQLI